MSNNPGKKGNPAPLVKRQESGLVAALYVYIREHHPEFAEWCDRRDQHRLKVWDPARRRYPRKTATNAELVANRLLHIQLIKENAALERRKKAWINRQNNAWDKTHPTPLTGEKRKELEAEFTKQYVPIHRS
jgi:hypothetical protein